MTHIMCIMVTAPDDETAGQLVHGAMEAAGATSAAVHRFDLSTRPALRAAATDIWGFEAVMSLEGERGDAVRVPSGCGHAQHPPTRAEIEDSAEMIVRVCTQCQQPIWWNVSQWVLL